MERLINAVKIDENTRFEFKPNPKRSGFKAHARYEAYQKATNLQEYLDINEEIDSKAGNADLKYDEEHGFLALYALNDEGEEIQLNPKED